MTCVFLRFSIFLSFNSCGTHLPVFRIFSNPRSRLETVCWLTANCSASCVCFRIIFVQFLLAIPHLRNFLRFPYSLSATSKLALLKRWNHRSLVSCNGAYSPQAFRNNMDDSTGVFYKWKQKNNTVRECSLLGINFDILNTTQHHAHTFPIYHPCAPDTCCWHNKIVQCQIFIAQTALVHHLLSEIRISYLCT